MEIPYEKTMVEIFRWRVEKSGEQIAHKFEDKETTFKELDMGTPYDFFGPESATNFIEITDKQRSNRLLLLETMTRNGFKNYSKEWWHYTLKEEPFNDYFNFVIE